jgi:hypothetical protein
VDDVETLEYLRVAVGREHGLSEAQSRRLVGSSVKALQRDAREMARELGLPDPTVQPRSGDGRYSTRDDTGQAINEAIRRAARGFVA